MTNLLAAMAGQGLSGLDVTALYPQASSPQATIIPGKLLYPGFFHIALITVAKEIRQVCVQISSVSHLFSFLGDCYGGRVFVLHSHF